MAEDRIVCAEPSCEASIPNHRWGKTRSPEWFFHRNGEAFCPTHVPK